MSRRFQIDASDQADLVEALTPFLGGKNLSFQELRSLLLKLRASAAPKDRVDLPAEITGRRALGIRARTGRYIINVEKSLLAAVIIAMDATVTLGGAAIAANLVGCDLHAIFSLSRETGELCNYISMEGFDPGSFPLSAEDVGSATLDRVCRQPELPCQHRRDGYCQITSAAVVKNIAMMGQRGVIDVSDDERVTSID